jgi:hypothetical protein
VRACVFTCVRVRACVCTRYDRCNWRFSAPSLIGLRIGLRRDCRHWWGDGMLLRVRVRVAVRAPACNGLRLWCFRLCFRLCFAHATIAPCASRCPKVPGTRLLLAPQASPHGAAGEPRKSPCYYALKPSRAPFSWARFSVSFSRSADLTFPIFTKPTTMDKKWQKLPGQFMDRSSRRCGRCGGWARPVLGAVAGADGLSDGSPVRIRPPACCAARHRCSQRRCARCSSWLDRRAAVTSLSPCDCLVAAIAPHPRRPS